MASIPSSGNFENWNSSFIDNLKPGGQYSKFLEEAILLIHQIIYFNSLFPPNESYTDQFISQTLPDVFDKILTKFSNLGCGETNQIVYFLTKSQVMIPWIAMHDKIELFDRYVKLTDPQMPFFRSISRRQEFKNFNDYFINHEFMALISMRIKKTDTPVSVDHFIYFFKLFIDHPSISDTLQLLLIFNIESEFSNFITSIDVQGTLDCDKIFISLKYFHQIISIFSETFSYGFSAFFNLPLALLDEKDFEKQKLATHLLSLFVNSNNDSIITLFSNFVKRMKLVTLLIKKELHPEIMKNLLPFIKSAIVWQKMAPCDLIIVYQIFPQNQNNDFFELIFDVLKKFSDEECQEFFAGISTPNLSFIKFSVLSLQKDLFSQLRTVIITSLIENSIECQDQTEVFSVIQPLCQKSIIKTPLLHQCQKSLENHCSISLFLILIELSKDSDLFQQNLFSEGLLSNIEQHFFEINDLQVLYQLYSKLLRLHDRKINHEVLKRILTENQNASSFLIELVKDGVSFLDENSWNDLNEFVNQYQDLANPDFFSFLKEYIVLANLHINKIKKVNNKYVVIAVPLEFEQKLIEMMLSTNIDLSKESTTLFLQLIELSEPKNLAIQHVIQLFLTAIDTNNQPEDVMRGILYGFLRFFYDYIKMHEKDSLYVYSHQFSNMKIIEGMHIFNVTGEDQSNEKLEFTLKLEYGRPISFLLCQIAANLESSLSHYSIALNEKDVHRYRVTPYGTFSVTVKYHEQIDDPIDPIDCFSQQGIVHSIFNFLALPNSNTGKANFPNHKFRKLLLNLLQKLPSDTVYQAMSIDPLTFLIEIKNNNNPYQVQYLLQILIWRLNSKKYLDLYSQDQFLLNTIIEKFRINPESLSCSVSQFIEIATMLNCIQSQEIVLPLLHFLSLQTIEDATKAELVSYLLSNKFDISTVFESEPEILENVIENINEKLFSQLKQDIFKVRNANSMLAMSTSHLNNPQTKNINFFIELFCHFNSKIPIDDFQTVMNSYLDLIQIPSISTDMSLHVLSSMKTLIENNHCQFCNSSELMKNIFVLIQSDFPKEIRENMYSIISLLSCLSKENRNELNAFIDAIASLQISKFGISVDNFTNIKTHKGLKNLGATCYMNSVLQQFANISGFVGSLASHPSITKQNPMFYQLQKLFCYLMHTKRPFYNPTQFFEMWASKQHIKASEQQDAQEFMQFFHDNLPPVIAKLYTGTITNFIEGLDHKFKTQINEPFISLPISIEKFTSVIDSLSSIKDKQKFVGDNQYTTEDGKKIDAENYQMITQSPPVLIIQLNRFRYNQETKMREKINTRFEIADHIDISNLLLTKEGNFVNYTLHGVVVHRGDGNHGHYVSYVKKNNDTWLKFDDIEVIEVPKQVYEDAAYGVNQPLTTKYGVEPNNMNGYLLFYVADNSFVTINNHSYNLIDDCVSNFPADIKAELDNDNQKFIAEQSVFTVPTFNFILEEASFEQFIQFYFNVFCHSSPTDDLITAVEKHIDLKFFKEDSNKAFLIDWLITKFNLILSSFVNCNSEKVTQVTTSFIMKTISSCELEKTSQIINMFIDFLFTCQDSCRNVQNISKFIHEFIRLHSTNCQNREWSEKLLKIVFGTYNGTRHDYFIQNVDISPIFDSIDLLIQKELSEQYQPLLSIASQVKKSPSANQYKKLILDLTSLSIFSIDEVIKYFPNDINHTTIIEIKFNEITDQSQLNNVHTELKQLSITDSEIISFLINNFSKFEIAFSIEDNFAFFFDLFVSDSAQLEPIFMTFLNIDKEKLVKLFEFWRSRMEYVSRLSSRTAMAFLRILLKLMISIEFPRSADFEELDFFKSYVSTMEFGRISSYLGNPYILTTFDDQFGRNRSFFRSYSQVTHFLQLIENIQISPYEIIKQLFTKPTFPEVLKNCVSNANSLQFDPIEKFVVFLLECKQKYSQDEELISQLIFAVLMSNSTPNFCVRLAKYFTEITEYLTGDEIASSLKIINNLLNNKANENIDKALSFYITPIFSYLQDPNITLNESSIKKLELNTLNILQYISSSRSQFKDMLIQFVVKIASLNDSFKRKSQSDFVTASKFKQRVNGYISATFLTEYCFIDAKNSSLSDEEICEKLLSIYLEVSSIDDESRQLLFKHYMKQIKAPPEIPQWAKLFVGKIFILSSLRGDCESQFFKLMISSFTHEELSDFLQQYSKDFDSDCFMKSNFLYNSKKPIMQLEQLSFLLELIPRNDIEQVISIQPEWFNNSLYHQYKSRILPQTTL